MIQKMLNKLRRPKKYSVKIKVSIGQSDGVFEIPVVNYSKSKAEQEALKIIETSIEVSVVESHLIKIKN
jgi:hypothetical protein